MNYMPQIIPITDMRRSQPLMLEKLSNGPVYLTQRGRAAAVMLSPSHWEDMNEQMDDLLCAVEALKAKLAIAIGEEEVEDFSRDELDDEEVALNGLSAAA
ncbi:type II toxin-antitoxin system Phd/YefM family antitoxin [Chloroflexi bacterium TSY]|nr:type II toxin-antitoxin system Phd/YefM family antitoxin [Chloroflexi bacterium TSY]